MNKSARTVGTVIRGIRAPIITGGDELDKIVTECVLNCAKSEGFELADRDIVGITEAVVARAQGNYITTDDIALDIKNKFGSADADKNNLELGVVFPILSRNRFAVCLRGIGKAAKKIYLMLSYPSDEVGNHLFDADLVDDIDKSGINIWTDTLTEKEYREAFGYSTHPFTGVDYVEYYKSLIEESGAEVEVIFSNDCRAILNYTKNILTCDIHTRHSTKRKLLKSGGKTVLNLADICTEPINGSGYNETYGLLGSNKATETRVKLFPRDCQSFVNSVAEKLRTATGKQIEVLIYGDGAFKDPQGKIWELADPVVSPAYTEGLNGVPHELKLKYLADNQFSDLKGDELEKAIREYIKNKDNDVDINSVNAMQRQGTTPRKLTDLIGSLCDLSSGSGDKGTPIILIQGYFDNISS